VHALGGDALYLVAADRQLDANFPAGSLEPLDVIAGSRIEILASFVGMYRPSKKAMLSPVIFFP